MIKFLRKIRRKTLVENKVGRYLTYAVGEIILVVIGILIALSINNWNQRQQQKKVLDNIYATIKADLQQDIRNIDNIVRSSELVEKDYLAIIEQTRRREDFKSCKNCLYVNFGFPNLKLRKNGSELLQNYNQQNNTSNDSLSVKLNSLYIDLSNSISVDLEELATNTNSFLEVVKYTQPWFADLDFRGSSPYNEDFVEYALTDFGYRNTTKIIYEMYFNNYIPHLKEYRNRSLEIISMIDRKLMEG